MKICHGCQVVSSIWTDQVNVIGNRWNCRDALKVSFCQLNMKAGGRDFSNSEFSIYIEKSLIFSNKVAMR